MCSAFLHVLQILFISCSLPFHFFKFCEEQQFLILWRPLYQVLLFPLCSLFTLSNFSICAAEASTVLFILFEFCIISLLWFLSKKLNISGSHFLAIRGKKRLGGNYVKLEFYIYLIFLLLLYFNSKWFMTLVIFVCSFLVDFWACQESCKLLLV